MRGSRCREKKNAASDEAPWIQLRRSLLHVGRGRRWGRAVMCWALGISPRTLRHWERRQEQPSRPSRRRGRPHAVPPEARSRIRAQYLERYKAWGPESLAAWCQREGLGRWSPSTIARVISDLRDDTPKPVADRRYEITASNVMWSEDGTAFGRGRTKRELLVAQDEHARFKTATRLVRKSATEADVAAYLDAAFHRYGAPLVLKHDGARIFHSAPVRSVLKRWQVLELIGPAYWPGYNGKQERSMRDIKSTEWAIRRSGYGGSLRQRLDVALDDLNNERPRRMLGGRTAREVYERDRVGELDRATLAEEVKLETKRLQANASCRRERRAARRRAVEVVLSRHGFLVEAEGSVN